jgi:glycine oxidase
VSHSTVDIAVIGAGIVGLCSAIALADEGLDVALIGDTRTGEASPTAAGILDASRGFADRTTLEHLAAARDAWPAFAARLTERSGVPIPLNRDGILELATTIHDAERLTALEDADSDWLSAPALAALEPHLSHAQGARRYHRDGAVNPLVVLRALKHIAARHVHIRVLQQTVTSLTTGAPAAPILLRLQVGEPISAMRVVVAAGAWSGTIPGIPMHLPVSPLRGQLISVASKALRHVVTLGDAYAVPRGDGRTILGAVDTSAGFDASHSTEGVTAIRTAASRILPAFSTAPMLSTWAGLRPMTRDGLPIIGPDPEEPSVIYACGHGRNGVLLGPVTGTLVADIVVRPGRATGSAAFSPLRFA